MGLVFAVIAVIFYPLMFSVSFLERFGLYTLARAVSAIIGANFGIFVIGVLSLPIALFLGWCLLVGVILYYDVKKDEKKKGSTNTEIQPPI